MNGYEKNSLASVSVPENNLLTDLARISKNNRGEPRTWGSTTLISSNEVRLQQNEVKGEIDVLFEGKNVPDYISPELANYIYVLNMARTVNRESHNQDSFAYREKMDLDGIPLEALEVFNRAVIGYASPAELLFVQKLLGIPSIELASLTHPYGQRIELLKEMRPAVNEAIVLLGGRLVKGVPCTYEVKGGDNLEDPQQTQGIHMTRKTIFGYLDDGTEIVERSSFVVLVEQLPDGCRKAIRTLPFKNNPDWNEQANRLLSKIVPTFLDEDAYDKAVPVSTTVVAINAKLEAKLLSEEAIRTRQRQFLAAHASKI